jgi:cytochrome c oxidase subunit 1
MKVFLRPNLARCIWVTPLVSGLFMTLALVVRHVFDMNPVWDPTSSPQQFLVIGYLSALLGFMIGIGAFSTWWPWMIGAPTRPEDHSQHGAYSWRDYFKFNTDHKVIGVQYVVTTFIAFLIGGMMAEIFRSELAHPKLNFIKTASEFNGFLSQHGTLMIFTFLVPVFAGIGNYVIPLMIGAPDMAFPRLNALSFWLLPLALVIFLSSFIVGSFESGWTAYPPFSTRPNAMGEAIFEIGVQVAGSSSIATAVNFLVTIITMRAPGMTLFRMPLLVWANLATSALVVAATPFIAGAQFMSMFDRVLGTKFFVPSMGGDVLAYQHVFWFYSHPAVYIMILPGFGIISEVISVMAKKPIFGYRAIAFSSAGIAILGFSVWAHHMFASGMEDWLRVPMMISTMLIAIPTGIKIFSWVGTLWDGVIEMSTAMLFAIGFIFTFVIGGVTGIWLAAVPFDQHVHDTYFVVAHFHFVLFGGSVMTVFAGLYFWYPKVTGRLLDERLGRLHFWVTFVASIATFLPMHWIGLEGMPRRVADYAPKFADWNLFISISGFILGAGMLIFVYNAIVSARHGQLATANPWGSMTLEWQLSSPPPIYNFPVTPRVVGGPYRYGEPGAVHAIFPEPAKEPAHA